MNLNDLPVLVVDSVLFRGFFGIIRVEFVNEEKFPLPTLPSQSVISLTSPFLE